MRNWENLDSYYQELQQDFYYQEEDSGHAKMSSEFVYKFLSKKLKNGIRVLDLGCGTGFMQPMIENMGAYYEGITWNEQEALEARKNNRNVKMMDFNFPKIIHLIFCFLVILWSIVHLPC